MAPFRRPNPRAALARAALATSAARANAGARAPLGKEALRALPDSKGGEIPKQLQTARADVYTYFTEAGETKELYSAENWVRIKLELQTAGPVAVGTSALLTPVLSGRGMLLGTNVPFEAYLPKGTRFYIAAGAVNRVNVTIEPVPWLEQISGEIGRVAGAVAAAASAIVQGLATVLKSSGQPKPTSSSGKTPDEMPCPPPSRSLLPRALRITPPKIRL